jgi:two-component system sensor kinase FixL
MKNAIEAMAAGPRRELTITSAGHSEDKIRITVADTGSGIAPDIRERLFQPFVTTKGDGMGVGLSICRSIVETHGGRLWVEDNPGGGSQFHFTLMRPPVETLGGAGRRESDQIGGSL